jgi:hypothetical protein
MQRLEVSGAVRLIYESLGVKRLIAAICHTFYILQVHLVIVLHQEKRTIFSTEHRISAVSCTPSVHTNRAGPTFCANLESKMATVSQCILD